MTDFKVGDKVRVIANVVNVPEGTILTVGAVPPQALYVITLEKDVYDKFKPSELELVKPEPTFKAGDEVTFVMPDFAPWQGGRGIVKRVEKQGAKDNFYVEVTEVPPANDSIRVGHTAWLYAEWLKLAPKPVKQDFGPINLHIDYPEFAAKVLGKFEEAKPEAVKHPAHYGGDTTYEAIKVIEAWGLGFNLGNAAKYLARAGKKGNKVEDLKKLVEYVQFEIAKEEAK